MLKKNNGFTLLELLIPLLIMAIIVVGVYVFLLKTVCQGNFWYAESSVLRELRVDHPNVTEVLKTRRNVFSKSVITVREGDENHDYCLDTSILWNYEFSECQD